MFSVLRAVKQFSGALVVLGCLVSSGSSLRGQDSANASWLDTDEGRSLVRQAAKSRGVELSDEVVRKLVGNRIFQGYIYGGHGQPAAMPSASRAERIRAAAGGDRTAGNKLPPRTTTRPTRLIVQERERARWEREGSGVDFDDVKKVVEVIGTVIAILGL